jgi:hypothetical protein
LLFACHLALIFTLNIHLDQTTDCLLSLLRPPELTTSRGPSTHMQNNPPLFACCGAVVPRLVYLGLPCPCLQCNTHARQIHNCYSCLRVFAHQSEVDGAQAGPLECHEARSDDTRLIRRIAIATCDTLPIVMNITIVFIGVRHCGTTSFLENSGTRST